MDDRPDDPEEPGPPGGTVAQPHDALFRFVFGKPVHAASELRPVLPPQLADRLDLASLRLGSPGWRHRSAPRPRRST